MIIHGFNIIIKLSQVYLGIKTTNIGEKSTTPHFTGYFCRSVIFTE